jgi:universal stress protein A
MQIQTILVPVDFSEHASAALDYSVELAKEFGATLHLLHCYPINVGGVSPYGLVVPPNLDRDLRDAASRRLGEWAQKVDAAGVAVQQRITPMFPSEAIANLAEEIGADLIVMGTRGLSGLKHVVLGSVAERTIRIAPCPVLTIKTPGDH